MCEKGELSSGAKYDVLFTIRAGWGGGVGGAPDMKNKINTAQPSSFLFPLAKRESLEGFREIHGLGGKFLLPKAISSPTSSPECFLSTFSRSRAT